MFASGHNQRYQAQTLKLQPESKVSAKFTVRLTKFSIHTYEDLKNSTAKPIRKTVDVILTCNTSHYDFTTDQMPKRKLYMEVLN